MDKLQECVDRLVSSGIQSYIGLLCCGERVRSRRVLSDTMQISSIAAGGPSALSCLSGGDGSAGRTTVPGPAAPGTTAEGPAAPGTTAGGGAEPVSFVRCVAFFTLRSLLASLLVLRATAYWARVPALGELQQACAQFSRCLEEPHGRLGATRPDDGGPGTRPTIAAKRTAPATGQAPAAKHAPVTETAPAASRTAIATKQAPAASRRLPFVAKLEVLDRGDFVETPNRG